MLQTPQQSSLAALVSSVPLRHSSQRLPGTQTSQGANPTGKSTARGAGEACSAQHGRWSQAGSFGDTGRENSLTSGSSTDHTSPRELRGHLWAVSALFAEASSS